MDQEIRVVRGDWLRDRELLLAVRHRVFVEEQKVPRELEVDDRDPEARHLFAMDEASRPVGTARWTVEPCGRARIGRVAVLSEKRRLGIGSLLMEAAISDIRDSGLPRVYLHAQVTSIPFYRSLGFVLTDDPPFEEAGIPHREMERSL